MHCINLRLTYLLTYLLLSLFHCNYSHIPEPQIRKSCANWANYYVPVADWSNPIMRQLWMPCFASETIETEG